jgi:hypothetical protein
MSRLVIQAMSPSKGSIIHSLSCNEWSRAVDYVIHNIVIRDNQIPGPSMDSER